MPDLATLHERRSQKWTGHKGAGFAGLKFGTSPDLVAEAVRRMSSARR